MDRTLPAKQRLRARVLLMADEGEDDTAIAGMLRTTRQRCGRIRKRFLAKGLQALAKDLPRTGRPKQIDRQRIITLTTTTPPDTAADWSRASMAKAAGVSASSVGRIWGREGIKPRPAHPKVSDEPRFAEKLEAIVGLYLAPPRRALALWLNRNSEVEARTRTPLPQGRWRTTALSAALNTLDDMLRSTDQAGHGHRDFVRFLQQVHSQIPAGQILHLFIGHDLPVVRPLMAEWVGKHPSPPVEHTLINILWLDAVLRLFRTLNKRPLRQGMFQSMAELQAAITDYHAAPPKAAHKPFIWTAKVADLRAKATHDKL